MWNSKKSTWLSIIVCFVLAFILLILLFFGPQLFELYMTSFRGFDAEDEAVLRLNTVFVWCFYPSAAFAAVILYSLLKLLFNIKCGNVFITQNVKCLKVVSWCCFSIAVITAVGSIFYMPFIFVAFAGGFTGMLLRVLKNVMQDAVILQTENDLTI